MRDGHFEGKGLDAPEIRALFARESMLASEWYAERLAAQQEIDCRLWERGVRTLQAFLGKTNYAEEAARLGVAGRLEHARRNLESVRAPDYLQSLAGSIGAQPLQTLTHQP
jgi:hypothetical protein